MFWSSTGRDINVIVILNVVALIISVYIYLKSKKKMWAIFIFSLLSNLIFWNNSGAKLFGVYHLKWIVKFTLWYWPWINLALFILVILNFLKNIYAKTK